MADRQGKVRPEYRLWYPELSPESWYPAAWLREAVLVQLGSGHPRWAPEGRILNDEHFEFRGGERGRGSGELRRHGDPPASGGRQPTQPESGVPPNA